MARSTTVWIRSLIALMTLASAACGGGGKADGDSDATDTSGDLDAIGEESTDIPDGDDEADATDAADAADSMEADGPEDATDAADAMDTTDPTDAVDATDADDAADDGDSMPPCGPGLTDCSGECVDLETDPHHCDDCSIACDIDENCLAGSCVPRAVVDAGGPVGPLPAGALAHAISTDGVHPFVAMVQDYGAGNADVHVRRFEDPLWIDVGTSLIPVARNAAQVVDIVFDGATPYVLYHEAWSTAHVQRLSAGAWTEVGAPGFTTWCSGLQDMSLALDGSAMPHINYFGAGGCGLGVGYAWFDGLAWQHHPSTAWPGSELITMNGGGMAEIVYTDRPYLALADSSVHSVVYWDGGAGAWTDLGSILDANVATGWQEASALASDPDGVLHVAWRELDSSSGPGRIYVKAWAGTDWTWLGAGPVSGPGDASNPSIAVIDGVPWVAWQEDDGTSIKIWLAGFDGAAWVAAPGPLNEVPADDAVSPDVTGIGRTVHVAFRESGAVHVKSF